MNSFKSNLVSVVVVTYNSSEFILETLNSIKDQTYGNLELIITDDCSKDNTIEICENWLNENSKRFKRTLLIKADKNEGTAKNCNKGIREVQGEYLKMNAGDDFIAPTFIEKCIPVFEENKDCGLVYTNSYLFNTKKNKLKKEDTSKYKSGNIFKEIFLLEFWPKSAAWMYRTEVIFEMGLYDETIWVEDYLLALKIAEKYKVLQVNEFLTYYRLHNNNYGGESIKLYLAQIATIDRFKDYKFYKKKRNDIYRKLSKIALYEDYKKLVPFFLKYKRLFFLIAYGKGLLKNLKRKLK